MNVGRFVVGVVCLLVVLSVPGAVVSGTSASTPPSSPSVFQQEFDADSVLLEIALYENGTAKWTVRYRLALETANESAAFDELQQDIQQNTSAYLSDFKARIQATVAAAENETGRQMAATNFAISTSEQPVSESGFVTYTFIWQNFAAVNGETIRAGDAISGLFLDSQTTLTMRWPSNYELTRVDPQYHQRSENAVTWNGRLSFGNNEPRVVVEPAGLDVGELVPWILGVVVLGGLLVAAIGYYRRGRVTSPTAEGGSPPGDEAGEPTTSTGADSEEAPPSELLSNEERVVQLLEANGGRMKQQAVVSELEWTEAKTSQVVNGMQEDDQLEVFRIGRENVLKLPEDDGDEDPE